TALNGSGPGVALFWATAFVSGASAGDWWLNCLTPITPPTSVRNEPATASPILVLRVIRNLLSHRAVLNSAASLLAAWHCGRVGFPEPRRRFLAPSSWSPPPRHHDPGRRSLRAGLPASGS